jgi:DNA-binding response OmpR family regulator
MMAAQRPGILLVGGSSEEQTEISSMLREAGFATVAAADARQARVAMARGSFAAAVISLPLADAVAFAEDGRCRRSGMKPVILVEPSDIGLIDDTLEIVLKQPGNARRLLDRIFELVLPGDVKEPTAAELGIAAAQLACLHNRHSAATASGAGRLQHDLMQQIRATIARHGTPATGGFPTEAMAPA